MSFQIVPDHKVMSKGIAAVTLRYLSVSRLVPKMHRGETVHGSVGL